MGRFFVCGAGTVVKPSCRSITPRSAVIFTTASRAPWNEQQREEQEVLRLAWNLGASSQFKTFSLDRAGCCRFAWRELAFSLPIPSSLSVWEPASLFPWEERSAGARGRRRGSQGVGGVAAPAR